MVPSGGPPSPNGAPKVATLVNSTVSFRRAVWIFITSVPRQLTESSRFTVLVALVTGVLFGLAPAWQAAKTDLNEALKDGSKGGGDGARCNRFRHALVVAEVALAFVLLVCSGLLLNSFLRLQRVNPGFDPHNVLTFRIALPASRYAQLTQVAPFYQKLIAQLETLPGVKSVSAISHLPLSANRGDDGFCY